VRVRQQAEILERCELVPDGRRRDVQVVLADQLGRRYRLGGRDVLADHRAE
jgi:hypothetical protein